MTGLIGMNCIYLEGNLCNKKPIINSVKETNPIVVNEVLNGVNFTYGDIEKVLKGLLNEKVSIRNMVTILEALANFGSITKNT